MPWAFARTAAEGCYVSEQSSSFGNSEVDHFDFCFTSTTQPPTGIMLGLPLPARAPTDNFPAWPRSGSARLRLLLSTRSLPDAVSASALPPSPLLPLAPGWPPHFDSLPSHLLLLCCGAHSRPAAGGLPPTATSRSSQTYLGGPVALWSWPRLSMSLSPVCFLYMDATRRVFWPYPCCNSGFPSKVKREVDLGSSTKNAN